MIPTDIHKYRVELEFWAATLYEILEMNNGFIPSHADQWVVDSESMLQKSSMHVLSILDLLAYTKPKVRGIYTNIAFTDHYSIQALVRSVLESYLVFHYIFLDRSVGSRVRKLRYHIWHASSLSERQKQSKLTPAISRLLRTERSKYLKMRRKILSSKSLIHINLAQRKKLEGKKPFDWKPGGGWRTIAKNTSLSETYWVDVYNLLSSSVHSSAVVSNNMSHKNQKDIQEGISSTAVSILNLILPLFVEGYALLFSRVESHLQTRKDLLIKIKLAKGVVSAY